jgi:uncharacterized paraquat-inducible protein A
LLTGVQRCGHCGRGFEASRFQPPERRVQVARLGESGPGAETACAAHAANAAVANCQRCGVFMCELCRIDADEMSLCPACFDRLSSEGALASTRTTFRDYGRQAITLVAAGVPLMAFGLAIGPAAVYYGVRSWRQLAQMGESGGRLRALSAIVLGLAETAFGAFFLWSIVRPSA